ncbi:hypothetical protein [Streptomyces sp. NPDC001404]|uniref:hypothetical protein n=1 Tax=Streptomyces sp. NPDC001404 TaxID=3364571 RepID=UPI00368DFD8A
MKRIHRSRLILTLLAVLAAVPATAVGAASAEHKAVAAPHVTVRDTTDTTDITGLYQLNANGYTGTLHILSANQGQVQADMRFYALGYDERVSGTWSDTSRTLTLSRPLAGSSKVQTYTLWAGGSNTATSHLMFGGYFTDSSAGHYGTFAEWMWR